MNTNETVGSNITEEATVKRKHHRRSPEEIAADKAAKEAAKAARLAAKQAKLEAKQAEAEADEDEDPSDLVPKKKAPKKVSKGNGQQVIMPSIKGGWSDPSKSVTMHRLYIELELLESALGTSPSNPKLLEDYIASRAPDAMSKAEEIAALGEEDVEKKGTTIFMRGDFATSPNGMHFIDVLDRKEGGRGNPIDTDVRLPFLWNYQLRGFFKDSCGLLARGRYGESANLTAFKKVIDGGIFVHPRRIALDLPETYYDENGELQACDVNNLPILQRPMRTSGPQGERTAIASSEVIPAGTRLKFCIAYTDPKWYTIIIEWLNYGAEHGLGAWRNSGRGIFRWRELGEDWAPLTDED